MAYVRKGKGKKKIALVDIDTFIFQAAKSGEETFVTVTNIKLGWEVEYKNKTSFYKCTKAHGVTGAILTHSEEDGIEYEREDFTIVEGRRLPPPDSDGKTPIMLAKENFNRKMKNITDKSWCEKIVICYGYGENFRYELAKTTPYKNNRKPKPLLYEELNEWVLDKYKHNTITKEGVESDDIITEHLYKDWVEARGVIEDLMYVGVFVDKDIPANTPFLKYNPNRDSEGTVVNTVLDAARNISIQMIMGDVADTIPGLPDMTNEFKDLWGIRKCVGVAEGAANKLLGDADSVKECFQRVVEAYQDYYGLEVKEVEGFRGDTFEWNWLGHLNEAYSLLRMQYKGEPIPNVKEVLDALKVKY